MFTLENEIQDKDNKGKEATLRKLIRNVKKCFCICNVKDDPESDPDEKEELESVGQLSNKIRLVEETSDTDQEMRGPVNGDGGGGQ